jgi:hypothetical protein
MAVNYKDIPAGDHDALVQLFLCKTTNGGPPSMIKTSRYTLIKIPDLTGHKI